jgi:hypothetical protein
MTSAPWHTLDPEHAARVNAATLGTGDLAVGDRLHMAFKQTAVTKGVGTGLVGLHDPIRPEVPQAIRDCLSAGITPVMITGDHPQTALNVAVQLGIAEAGGEVLLGRELASLSDEELLRRIGRSRVCARVDPEQKIRKSSNIFVLLFIREPKILISSFICSLLPENLSAFGLFLFFSFSFKNSLASNST